MQSRFPRKDAENGKTSAPYAVIQGLSDIFPGFEDWLRGHLSCQVHGHLLGPEGVEFAGRARIGPGAISADPLRSAAPSASASVSIPCLAST